MNEKNNKKNKNEWDQRALSLMDKRCILWSGFWTLRMGGGGGYSRQRENFQIISLLSYFHSSALK